MQIDNDKLWSISAEGSVLGSILFDDRCFDKVLAVLPDEEYFFDSKNKLIYAALMKLRAEGIAIDGVTLRGELDRIGKTKEAGGVEYIEKILDTTPSSANAVYYAKIVKDRYQYRELVTGIEKMQGVLDEPICANDAIEKVRNISLDIEPDRSKDEYFAIADHIDRIAEQSDGQQEIYPTGFKEIDKFIQGIVPGNLCVIAGRPSMGKSALGLDIAINMAEAGKSIVFFTLEMTHGEIMERAIVRTGKVSMARMREGLSQIEKEKSKEAAIELKSLNIVFHETADTPDKQSSFVRTTKKARGVDVVVVDYLQLMHTGRRSENRTQEVTTISRKLKMMAKREHIAVIALSQLNRRAEERASHRPLMSDLRESGAIEQDADYVLLLHREDYYRRYENPDTESFDDAADVIVAKARNCPTGTAKLTFLRERIRFYERASEQ